MYTIKLMNEFMHGVIWVYEDDVSSYYDLKNDDQTLNRLNKETEDLYDSYFEFDSYASPCWFNEELEEKNKDKMLFLINKIKQRLDEINNGSFVVEDYETEHLQSLQNKNSGLDGGVISVSTSSRNQTFYLEQKSESPQVHQSVLDLNPSAVSIT